MLCNHCKCALWQLHAAAMQLLDGGQLNPILGIKQWCVTARKHASHGPEEAGSRCRSGSPTTAVP